jgi:histidine ammonia-lyase
MKIFTSLFSNQKRTFDLQTTQKPNLMLFFFGKDRLTVSKAIALSQQNLKGSWDEATRSKIEKSEQATGYIAKQVSATYGINTGFGPLCTTKISPAETRKLQTNILKSHSVGVGKPIDSELVRLMLVLKLHALSYGYSGVSFELLKRMQWHLENDCIPVVPEKGSVGASGDLAPLAHLFLPLIGLGKVVFNGREMETSEALQKVGLKPIELGPKEGLALINGTQFILAHAVKLVEKMHNCLAHADLVGAMTADGLQASIKPFSPELHQLRPHPGAIHVANNLHRLLENSSLLKAHEHCERVQDPYSLRCMPQVHGASRDAWLHLKNTVEIELNSVTDNPIIFDENHSISGGNFHGQPLALPIDYACLATSELGNISDRRIYLSLLGDRGIPKLLMPETGINSGFMMLQYTTAALASENKTLCFPASADSIPTSLGQEDHVSMGAFGARKALQVAENTTKILAIELLCAAQAIDLRRPLQSSETLENVHREIRKHIPFATEDRIFSADIEKATALVESGELLKLTSFSNPKNSNTHELFEIY